MVQRTKLIDETQDMLLEMLEDMTTGLFVFILHSVKDNLWSSHYNEEICFDELLHRMFAGSGWISFQLHTSSVAALSWFTGNVSEVERLFFTSLIYNILKFRVVLPTNFL